MMNILFSNYTNAKLFFTRHAKERTLQRFRLFLTKTEQDNVELFLSKDFSKSVLNKARYCMTPFYINKIESKDGKNSFITSSKYLDYFCKYDKYTNTIIVKTVVKRDG